MKRKPVIIFGICIAVVLCLATAAFFIINSPQFKQHTAQLVAQQVQSVLKNKVNMGTVEVVSINSAAVDDIEIYDKQDELIAKADRVTVTINLWDIITRSPLAGISDVDVKSPQLFLEQRSDGKWNVEDLIDTESNAPVDFQGDITVTEGQATVRLAGKQLSAENINLTADCADLTAIEIDGSLRHNDANVKISGTLGSSENTDLEIVAENLDIMNYLPFIPEEQLGNVNIKSGFIPKADIHVVSDFKGGYALNGSVNFRNGACEILNQDIENIMGLILIDREDLQLFVRGEAKQQVVSVHGKVLDYMTEPELRLIAESKAFNPALFIENSPFDGNVSLIAAAYGKMDELKVGAELKADTATVYGMEVKNLDVSARYAQNQIFVDDLRADVLGGWLWASGQCDLNDFVYKGSFRTSNIDLAMLQAYLPDVTGRAAMRGDFKGQGLDFAGLNLSGRLEVNDGSYQMIPVQQVQASFYKEGDNLQVDALTASFANGGRLAAKGGLIKDEITADFYASGIDLSLVQNFTGQLDLSGTANFSGRLHGNTDNPVLKIDLMAQDGAVFKQPFDSLLVSAIGNLDGMRVDTCQFINKGEVTHEATGLLGFKGKKFIDMTVTTNKARMENLIAAVMPDLKLTGNVDNKLHLTGSLEDIKAEGSLHFYEGSINGILLTEVNGAYEYVNGDTHLKNFVIVSPFLKANLDGTISKDQELNFKFKADEILIDKLQVDLPYPAQGKASFDGTLSGKVGGLNFDGILTADDIVLNGEQIDDVYGRLKLANRILSLEKFAFKQNGGEYDFDGQINLNTKQVQGRADIVQADINAAMAMANLKNNLLNGKFNGRADLSGTYENPHVDLKGSMPEGKLKDYPLNNIEIDAQLENSIIKINRFYGEQGAGKVAAIGSVDLTGGSLDGRISASNMDINLLTHLCDLNVTVNGVMNTDIQLAGTLASPTADVAISVQGDGSQFDTAYLMANLRDDIIYINQATAKKGECALKAEGSIPLAALDTTKRDEDSMRDSMDLRVYLENTDLNILPSLTPYVEWSMGNVQGNLSIKGTVANPDFQGNISTKDSAIKFAFIDSPLQNINMDIDFNRNLMTVKQFDGVMGNGSYTMTGMANISGNGITNYNFNLDLNHLDVVSDFYTGPLNGSLQLNETTIFGGRRTIPKLTANLDFNNITLSTPPLPETSDSPLPLMALDINVNVGDNVHAYDPLLYDLYIEGAFSIKGTTRHPDSSGSLHARNGTINVLKTIFKINEGNVVFNQVDSFFPSVEFLATTRLDRTVVFVTVSGAVDKNLTTRLRSDPQMSEAEILKLLAFRTDYSNNSGEITEDDLVSFATVGLQMSFLNELEGTLRNVLNLDEFRISRDTLSDSQKRRFDTDDGEVYNIEIGKYLSDDVMLKYTKGINYDLDRIGLQYYINSNLGVITEVEDGGYNIKVEMQWKF